MVPDYTSPPPVLGHHCIVLPLATVSTSASSWWKVEPLSLPPPSVTLRLLQTSVKRWKRDTSSVLSFCTVCAEAQCASAAAPGSSALCPVCWLESGSEWIMRTCSLPYTRPQNTRKSHLYVGGTAPQANLAYTARLRLNEKNTSPWDSAPVAKREVLWCPGSQAALVYTLSAS